MNRNLSGVLVAATVGLLALVGSGCSSDPRTIPDRVSVYATLANGRNPLTPQEPATGPLLGAALRSRYHAKGNKPCEILIISGGGQNGAFGSGFLKGWTETGQRPVFDLVTGVSTGALSAPFAFLGTPADDKLLADLYLSIQASDVYSKRFVLTAIFSDSFLDNHPLHKLLEKWVTPELIARVAQAYDEGRRLLVQTTNMDDGQVWVWDLSRLAKEQGAAGAELFRRVMLASASVPLAFPPQIINGWMHCDGSVRHDILLTDLYGQAVRETVVEVRPREYRSAHLLEANVYIIVNSGVGVKTEAVEDGLAGIGGRAIGILLDTSLESSLFRSFIAAHAYDMNLRMAWIPSDVSTGSNALAFDQKIMHKLFETGSSLAKSAAPWKTHPPMLDGIRLWMDDAKQMLDQR